MSETRTVWPQPGDLGSVKCSDTRWRTAFCVNDALRGLTWIFPDNSRRYVDTSTARQIATPTPDETTESEGNR